MVSRKSKDDLPKVFLYDTTIPMFGKRTFSVGSNILISHEGSNDFNVDTARFVYQVRASAIKYLANIQRRNYGEIIDETPRTMALFHGTIQINKWEEYIQNEDETKIAGFRLIAKGDIWAASLNVDMDLDKLILGKNNSERGIVKRIGQIIRGYQHQDQQDESARRSGLNSARVHGMEMAERGFGMR